MPASTSTSTEYDTMSSTRGAVAAASTSKMRLRWHEHGSGLTNLSMDLCGQEEMADVSIACDGGEVFNAHRMVLASASEYFRKIFRTLDL